MKSLLLLKTELSRCESVMARTKPIWDSPMQTPGPFVTGRSNYTMGKRLDIENNRKAKAFAEYEAARKEHERLTQLIADVEAGERHTNGMPRADSPSRIEAAKTQEDVVALLHAFFGAHLKVGDRVGTVYGSTFEIKPINRKSITSMDTWGGEPVKYELREVVLIGANGKPMEIREFAKLVGEWEKGRTPS